MASNKRFTLAPYELTASATNILNPPTATGGVNAGSSANYIVLYHLHCVNQTSTIRTVRLFLGATGGSAAGTEISPTDWSIPANDMRTLSFPGGLRLDSTQFLTGLASAADAVTVHGGGEIGVA